MYRRAGEILALRTGHGNGKGVPRIEVSPPDELPKPIPALPPPPEAPDERDENGRFKPGSKTAQARGGKSRKHTVKLTRRTSIADESQLAPGFIPYKRAAESYRKFLVSELASQVGAGTCGVMAAGFISDASLQKALGQYLIDQAMSSKIINAGMAKMGSSILNDARQTCLAAFEVCGKMAGKKIKDQAGGALLIAQQKFQESLAKQREELAAQKRKPVVVESTGEETE